MPSVRPDSFQIRRHEQGGAFTLKVDGVLDGTAALQVGKMLDELGGLEVTVDLTQTKECRDVGVAVLAYDLARRNNVRVTGVRQRQEHVLQLFGVQRGEDLLRR